MKEWVNCGSVRSNITISIGSGEYFEQAPKMSAVDKKSIKLTIGTIIRAKLTDHQTQYWWKDLE